MLSFCFWLYRDFRRMVQISARYVPLAMGNWRAVARLRRGLWRCCYRSLPVGHLPACQYCTVIVVLAEGSGICQLGAWQEPINAKAKRQKAGHPPLQPGCTTAGTIRANISRDEPRASISCVTLLVLCGPSQRISYLTSGLGEKKSVKL